MAILFSASALNGAGETDLNAGLALYKKSDFVGAFAKWRDAADAGNPAAMRNIGYLFRHGKGVKRVSTNMADVVTFPR